MDDKRTLSSRRKRRRLISDDEGDESGAEYTEITKMENSSSKNPVVIYSDDEYEFKLSDEDTTQNKPTLKKIKTLKNDGYNEQSPSPFDNVPSELLMYLLLFLDFKDMCNVSKVCKRWKILSEQDIMWTELCRRHSFSISSNQSSYKTRINDRFGKPSYTMKTLFKHKHILKNSNEDVQIIETKPSNGTKKESKYESKKSASKGSTPRKKSEPKAKAPPPKPPSTDVVSTETREKWKKLFTTTLSKPPQTDTEKAALMATAIETETFRQNSSSRHYTARMRTLQFNLNAFDALRQGILSGRLSTIELCEMNHDQMKNYN